MKKKSNIVFYILSLLLIIFFWKTAYFWYNMRYMLVTEDDKLNAIVLLAIEVISVYLIISSPKHRAQEKWIHWVCFLWEVIMIVVLIFNRAPMGHYVRCLAWPLFFEAAYMLLRFNIHLIKKVRVLFYLFVFIGGIVFFAAMELRLFESQTNMIYFLLLPTPVLMLRQNAKMQYNILLFVSFFALMSMKRSMMLSVALCWVILLFSNMFKKGKKSMAILLSVLIIGSVYTFWGIVDNLTHGGLSARTTDYEKDDITNGREGIYLLTIDMISRSSNDHLLLGHGHNGVKSDSRLEISAHNEFLEIIYDYGIIGLLVYLALWIYVVRQWLYHFRKNSNYFIPYTLSICIFAVMAMVSQLVIYVSYFLYLVMFWGMVQALKEREKNESIIYNKRFSVRWRSHGWQL